LICECHLDAAYHFIVYVFQINGNNTLSENLADIGGIKQSLLVSVGTFTMTSVSGSVVYLS